MYIYKYIYVYIYTVCYTSLFTDIGESGLNVLLNVVATESLICFNE